MVEYMNKGSSGFQQFMASRDADKKAGANSIFIWALIAIMAGWLVYGWLAPSKSIEHRAESIDSAPTAQIDIAADVPAQTLMGDAITARVAGLRMSDIELKNYPDVRLLSGSGEFLEVGFSGAGTDMPAADTLWRMNRSMGGPEINLSWVSPSGVEFRRTITMSADYVINISDTVINKSAAPISIGQYTRIIRAGESQKSGNVQTGGIARANDVIKRESWKKLVKSPMSFSGGGGFVGFTDQYWQTVVGMDSPEQNMRVRANSSGKFQADTAADAQTIAPGAEHVWTTRMFAGPKNQADLAAAAAFMPGVDQTVDYGWFWFLARPFLWSINAIHGFVGNYGVAIIIFTILLRLLMWPLTKKSVTAMSDMQKLQPEMQRLQKLYGDDKKRLQAEMMNLYKSRGTSPMGGCLPMILQIPIFFALYKALLISVPMRSAGFLWVADLAARDPLFILPIVMGATMWFQQKLQTSYNASAATDEKSQQMQKMMKYLPIIFTAMFAFMPAGLVLYWTVSNMFGIGQMLWIKRGTARPASK